MSDAAARPAAKLATVVLAYAAFAALWILLSDRAMGVLFRDPETLVQASMFKGWFFVVVTSLLLYGLVGRMTTALSQAHERELALERERKLPPPMLVAIAEASSDAIFAKDEEGRYLLVSKAAAGFLGRRAEEALGQDDRALFPPEQAASLMASDRRVRGSGVAETREVILQTAEGERVFLAFKGPLRGADGRIFGTCGISRDITGRKREEEALRTLADDLSATLHAIPDLMFELDAEGRYLKTKAMNESLLMAPQDSLTGRTVSQVLPAGAATTVLQALAAAQRSGSDFGRTIVLPVAAGERHFELSVARKPLLAGQGERFIVLSRDITERKAADAALLERNRELERFNRAATEREVRMVALKREVNELARAAGRPAPYDTSFADVAGIPAAP